MIVVVVIGESLLVLFMILFPASGYGEFNYHWRYYAPVPGYGELQYYSLQYYLVLMNTMGI